MTHVSFGRRLGQGVLAGVALAAALALPAVAETYDGDWSGALSVNGQTLHLVLHIKTASGETSAVLDSVDQGASIPSTAVKTENGQIMIFFAPILGDYTAKLAADGKSLNGTWTQGGSLPLVMTKK